VQASVGERLTPPPGGFPRLQALVQQGDVLAYVTAYQRSISPTRHVRRTRPAVSIVERQHRYEQLAWRARRSA
jgi:hypothetical protein